MEGDDRLIQTKELTDILKLDNGVEDVFRNLMVHLTDDETDLDINLEKMTADGDTLLHRIVNATVDHPEHMDLYMELVDIITTASVVWWCKAKELPLPQKKEETQKYKYLAMNYLLANVFDLRRRSVWTRAVELQSVDMLRKLAFLEDVTCFVREDEQIFILGESDNEQKGLKHHLPAIIEGLKSTKGDEMLRIKPFRKMAEAYSLYFRIYCVVTLFFHIVFMAVLSYAGFNLMDPTRPQTSITTKGLLYGFGSIEAMWVANFILICLFILFRANILKDISSRICMVCVLLILLAYMVLLCLVLDRVDNAIGTSERYILSLTLLCGWLSTFFIASLAFENVFIFCHLLLKIIFTDVLTILLVYSIFLCGFSMSIHAQFISSPNITSTYKTPIHTMYLMFNVMMGITEAVDDQTGEYLEAANTATFFSKLLYIVYVLFSTIILLNMLIAMMNTTYYNIHDYHYRNNTWLKYTSLLSISIFFLYISDKCEEIQVLQNLGIDRRVWYISIPKKELKKDEKNVSNEKTDIQNSVQQLKAEIHDKQREILERIKDLQEQVSILARGNVTRQAVSSQTQISTITGGNDIKGLSETVGKPRQEEDRQTQTFRIERGDARLAWS